MTRKSRREIERAIERLGVKDSGGDDGGSGVVYETSAGYVDEHGEPIPTDESGDPDVEPPAFGPTIILDAEYVTPKIKDGGRP